MPDKHYPEERPSHRVTVDGFWMDCTPVTNARFAQFVGATGHVTFAEVVPKAEDYPGALPDQLFAGSLVFVKPDGPVDLKNIANWWRWMQGADWRHPQGPESSNEERGHHPVVHVALADAETFAAWEGKSLPTEAEWEFAARGGLDGAAYAWGNEFLPATATWPTPGRDSSPGRARRMTATKAPRPSMRFRRMAMVCTT